MVKKIVEEIKKVTVPAGWYLVGARTVTVVSSPPTTALVGSLLRGLTPLGPTNGTSGILHMLEDSDSAVMENNHVVKENES